jgi:hypothetical protein
VRAKIQEAYPGFSYLLDVPEVANLLEQAFTGGWSESRFLASLYATNYYRERSESQRRADVLAKLDPAEYSRQAWANFSKIDEFAAKLGVNLSYEEKGFMAASQLNQGRDINDPAEQMLLLNWLHAHPDRVTRQGTIWANAQRADQISRQEFFYAPEFRHIIDAGINFTLGADTEDAYRQNLAEWFATITPHLANRLKAGETYAQIVNPLRDYVAKELELGSLEDVDMISTNQWKWLMGMPDPTSGEVRLPTQQEVISAARKDPRWNRTVGGTALATSLVDGITKSLGVRT